MEGDFIHMRTEQNEKKNLKYCLSRLADFYNDPIYYFQKISKDKTTAILLGTPAHYNIGDHLIAKNEIKFLKEYCSFEKIIEIPTRIFLHQAERLKEKYNPEIPVFITGGGWMGDVWPEDEKIIEQMIITFKDHKIIIMPQTIYYDDLEKSNGFIRETCNVFANSRKLMISCRDCSSLAIASRLFVGGNVQGAQWPDMGLLKQFRADGIENRIALCLRDDREKSTDIEIEKIVKKYAHLSNTEVTVVSTMSRKPVPIWKRESTVNKTMRLFARHKLIVTDRLHGMIFSIISGTACIALDNKTHKVRGVYDLWLKDNPNVYLIENGDSNIDIEEKISELMSGPVYALEWKNRISDCFEKMSNDILNFIRNED